MNGAPVESKIRLALDEHLTVLSVCDGIEELLGFSAEDLLKAKVVLKDRVHAEDADIAGMLFSRTEKKTQEPLIFVCAMRTGRFGASGGSLRGSRRRAMGRRL